MDVKEPFKYMEKSVHTNQNTFMAVNLLGRERLSISIKYLILLLAVSVSGLTMLSGNLVVEIVAIWCLCAVAILLCGIDLIHPYFCYSVGFCLYATAYPILCIMDGTGYTISKELLPLNWLALSTFLLVMTPRKANKRETSRLAERNNSNVISRLSILSIALFVFIIFYFYFFVVLSGITTKGDFSYNFVARVWLQSGVLLLFVYAIMLMILLKNRDMSSVRKGTVAFIVLICGMALFLQGTLGERDCWFKFIGISIFCFYASGVLKNKHFIFLVPAIIAVLGFSVSYKYFFLAGRIYVNDNSIIESFLRSDFGAASKNLEVIIDNNLMNYFSPLVLITDSLPGSNNIGGWFTNVYMNASYGLGFTIVGFGYITFGLVGIVLVMTVVALITKYIYLKSSQSPHYFAAYIMFILYSIYACRGTLYMVVSSAGICIAIGLMLSIFLDDRPSKISAVALKECIVGAALYMLIQVPEFFL